jgi:hypothetical protein
VNRDKAFAALHKFQQGRLLGGGDGIVVGVYDQAVVLAQGFAVKGSRISGIGDVDALLEQGRGQHRGELLRMVVLALVPQK